MEDYIICIVFIVLGFILSLIIESIILPKIIQISRSKCLFDIPDERKQHKNPVPRLGGVSFLPILLFVVLIVLYVKVYVWNLQLETLGIFMMLVCGMLILYITGIKDDLSGISYPKKFIMQFIASIFLIASGTYINNFYGLFGIYEIPLVIGVPFTILLCMFITNSINLIDGIDGLASGISAFALVTYGCMFFISKQWSFSIICFSMLGVLISFFYYNVFSKNKIFMGDTGSLLLGYLLSFLGIRLAMNIPELSTNYPSNSILTVGSALFIPMFDAIKVMYARLCIHRSMFYPDRRHIHHRLIDIGFSQRSVMLILISAAIIITLSNYYAAKYIEINIIFILNIITIYVFNKAIAYQRYKKKVLITSLVKFPKEEFQDRKNEIE
jgi:UDP-N-acetylmuramyl pentapeptide phosphotransferase/UDP-N-acetylglucosamine-1-phosphate transferase